MAVLSSALWLLCVPGASARVGSALAFSIEAAVALGGGFFGVVTDVLNSDFAALVFGVLTVGGEAVRG